MTEKQREFLIKKVEETRKRALNEVNEDLLEPSLNNYLISAILDGSIQMKSEYNIYSSIKQKVLNLGPSGSLIKTDTWGEKYEHELSLRAEDLFIFPEAYLKARAEYIRKYEEQTERKSLINSQAETIVLKLQLGTSASLDKLITEADNLVDLSLLNATLSLTAPVEQPRLPSSKSKR